jgi:hypothetical protein
MGPVIGTEPISQEQPGMTWNNHVTPRGQRRPRSRVNRLSVGLLIKLKSVMLLVKLGRPRARKSGHGGKESKEGRS